MSFILISLTITGGYFYTVSTFSIDAFFYSVSLNVHKGTQHTQTKNREH